MQELKFKAIVVDEAKKQVVYRFKGGVWLNKYQDNGDKHTFYLRLPKEVAAEVQKQIEATIGQLPNGFSFSDQYEMSSTGVAIYKEVYDLMPHRDSILAEDIVVRFSLTYMMNKKGEKDLKRPVFSKTVVAIKVSEQRRNWFESDADYFGYSEQETPEQAAPAAHLEGFDVPF